MVFISGMPVIITMAMSVPAWAILIMIVIILIPIVMNTRMTSMIFIIRVMIGDVEDHHLMQAARDHHHMLVAKDRHRMRGMGDLLHMPEMEVYLQDRRTNCLRYVSWSYTVLED